MSITLADAIVYLTADASGIEAPLKDAKNRVNGWASSAGSMAKTALTGAIVGGATLAAGAVAGIGVAAFNVASDVDAATGDIQAAFGLTEDAAAEFADVGLEVFKNNFAANVGEAAEAVARVNQLLGEMPREALQQATEGAFAFQDAFGVDTEESLNAAKTLMDEFGLTSEEAFDFMTSGMQSGLNKSGDFLDSIGEYSNLFKDAGFDASEFYSLMETGAAGGVLGTDKIADAIKEMGIILNEGDADAQLAFESMGLNFDGMAQSVADGKATWGDYFPAILEGLQGIEDPIERNKAQVAIFGTMAEDLGVSFTDGLSTVSSRMSDFEGSTSQLNAQYNTLGDAVEGYKRRAIVALAPLGDRLLQFANDIMPQVEAAFAWFETVLIPMLFAVGETFGAWFANIRDGNNQTWNAMQERWERFFEHLRPLVEAFLAAVQGFWGEWGDEITALVTLITDGVKAIFDLLFEDLLLALDFFTAIFNGDWEEAGRIIAESWQNKIDFVVEAFSKLWERLRPWLTGLWTNITTFWNSIDWAELGRNVINGIGAGIAGAAASLGQRAAEAARNALNAAKAALGIQSPSKVAAREVGVPFAQGIAAGIGQEMANVSAALGAHMAALTQSGASSAREASVSNRAFTSRDNITINVRNDDEARLVERLIANAKQSQVEAFLAR